MLLLGPCDERFFGDQSFVVKHDGLNASLFHESVKTLLADTEKLSSERSGDESSVLLSSLASIIQSIPQRGDLGLLPFGEFLNEREIQCDNAVH